MEMFYQLLAPKDVTLSVIDVGKMTMRRWSKTDAVIFSFKDSVIE